MDQTLTEAEVRVLGSLIEKEITTPDYYPLSLNALMAACNQSSNRNPVVHYDEDTVVQAADLLREKKLVHLIARGESRVNKYRHVLYEAMNMGRPDIAAMCILMLRGPQTIGEIRTRSNRLYDFTSIEQVETTLNGLMAAVPPLVVRLPISLVLVVIAARTDRPWVLPIAVTLALPVVWLNGLAILAACWPLRSRAAQAARPSILAPAASGAAR